MRIPVKSNDVKLPFIILFGFSKEKCVTLSFHKTEMLTDFVTYTQEKGSILKIILI
jgi:magnesium transporter